MVLGSWGAPLLRLMLPFLRCCWALGVGKKGACLGRLAG